MKKISAGVLAACSAILLAGCASGPSGAKNLVTKAVDLAADESIVGYYTFEEEIVDNEITDHSVNGLNVYSGALDGSVLTDGIKGKALLLNGSDEFITLDQSALEGSGFTFAAWVKSEGWTTWARLFDLGDTKCDVFLGVDGRSAGTLGMREEGSQIQCNTPLPEMDTWVHIAGTFGDGRLVIYVNGEQAADVACPTTPAQVAATATGLYIGRSNWPDPFLKGALDEVVVANRVLSAEEIAWLYVKDAPVQVKAADNGINADPFVITEDSGVIGYFSFDEPIEDNEVTDHSGNDLSVSTGSLDPSVTVAGHSGNALLFNGSDEYITLEPETLSGDGCTIAMWVNPTAWLAWARIFDLGDQKEDAWLGMDGASGMLRLDIIGGKSSISMVAPLPQMGKWTHVAVTFDGSEACLYVNGKLKGRQPSAVLPSDIAANAQGLYIGRSNWADPLYNGLMDDVFVANRVLSAAEVASVAAGVKVSE